MKKYRMVGLLCLVAFCAFAGCKKQEALYICEEVTEDPAKEEHAMDEEDAETVSATELPEQIVAEEMVLPPEEKVPDCVVHVCGAVLEPGVYILPEGSRIYEAVAMAGGLSKEADGTFLNQAELLTDGEQIYVPTIQEVSEGTVVLERSASRTAEADGQEMKINLNTATKEQLCTLPGIGESKANSILAYRETNGAYECIEDIMKVEGIKDGLFQKIKDQITV